MSNQELDKLFKNKLTDSVREPSADAWNKIQGKMNKTKKRGIWFYGKIAAAVLLLATVTVLMVNYNHTPGDITSSQIAQNDLPDEEDMVSDRNEDKSNNMPLSDSISKAPDKKETIIEEEKSKDKKEQTPAPIKKEKEMPKNLKESKDQKKRTKQPTININSKKDNLAQLNASEEQEENKLKNTIPDATSETTFASTEQKEQAKGQTLTFNIEEFKKKEVAAAQPSETPEEKSTFNKVIKFAKNLKESDGLGELREAKNELLAFNFKKDDNSK